MTTKRGPKTDRGRQAVRSNALKYGIWSDSPVIKGVETEESWHRHLEGIKESLAPSDYLEATLAERIAIILWRMHRLERFEADIIRSSQESIVLDSLRVQGSFDSDDYVIEEPSKELEFLKAVRSLIRRVISPDESTTVWSYSDVKSLAVVLQDNIECDSPTLEELTHLAENIEGTRLFRKLEIAASEVGETLESLLFIVDDNMVEECQSLGDKAREVRRSRKVMRSLRTLPDDDSLEKVIRAESHLQRLLLQTMHELEAMQERRRGASTPLARLDVVGESELLRGTTANR